MIPDKLVQVYLVSNRPEIVLFWKAAVLDFCALTVLSDLGLFISGQKQNEQRKNAVAIIDSLVIASADEMNFFISENHISLQKVFIIKSLKSNLKILTWCENHNLDFIPFPCNFDFLRDFLLDLSSSSNSDSTLEKSDSDSVSEKDFTILPRNLKRFVGTSFSAKILRKNFYTFGKTDLPLILEGESGTGKTFAAELIHSISKRSSKQFRRINMPCIQAEIAESELFGSVSGAFTGATNKKGILQELDGGTVLFDEVSEIPMLVQAKLLKFLDCGCFCRVGSTKETYSDVRVISATNVNLEERVRQGVFRRDLYERLKGKIISIPSLNSRKEDIDALVENFLLEHNYKSVSFSKEAINVLKSRSWPGNVRELEHCLLLTCSVTNKQLIGPDDLIFAS